MPRKDPLMELMETHLQAQRLLGFHLKEHKECKKGCKILTALLEVIKSLPSKPEEKKR